MNVVKLEVSLSMQATRGYGAFFAASLLLACALAQTQEHRYFTDVHTVTCLSTSYIITTSLRSMPFT